jgi:hypothetical protein
MNELEENPRHERSNRSLVEKQPASKTSLEVAKQIVWRIDNAKIMTGLSKT